MKNRGERPGRWGEGWLLAAALGLVLALSLAVHMLALPRAETAPPLHSVPLETLRRMELLNLNAATAEELEQLPGIGRVLAERIVAHREANGPFSALEDLLEVDGFGEGKLEEVRSLACVG